MTQKGSDLQKIKELLKIMKANDLVELEIKHGDDKIVLKRSGPAPAPTVTPMPMVAAGMPAMVPAADANGVAVPSGSAAGAGSDASVRSGSFPGSQRASTPASSFSSKGFAR